MSFGNLVIDILFASETGADDVGEPRCRLDAEEKEVTGDEGGDETEE